MAVNRGILFPLMFHAVEKGTSFNEFYRRAKEQDISYRRGSMLADWRHAKSVVERRDALRDVGTTDYPELTEVSESKFKWTEEFVYKARVEAQITRKAPVTERFVTILSSKPLTMGEIEEQVSSKWPTYEYGKREHLVTVDPIAAIHWVGE